MIDLLKNPPASIQFQLDDGLVLRASRRDDLGVIGLYEHRSVDESRGHADYRYWQIVATSSRGAFVLEDVTTTILRRLLTGLAQSKLPPIPRDVLPDGPEAKPGMERDDIPDPEHPKATIRVTRRLSTLERLLRQRVITRRHLNAAEALYTDYLVGFEGARVDVDGELPPGVQTGPFGKDGMTHNRLIAAQAFHHDIGILGPDIAKMLLSLIIKDLSLTKLAKQRRWDKRKTLGFLIAGLEVLAVRRDRV